MSRFITIEWIPYEGQGVRWYDTEEEALKAAKDHLKTWRGSDNPLDVYEIAREIKYEGNE